MQWSSNLCRICGHYRVCHSISKEIGDKMKRYLNIKIATGPEYKPQHLCYKCSSKLIKFVDFINLSHKNDLKFDSLHQRCLEICQKKEHAYMVIKSNKSVNRIIENTCNEELFVSKFQMKNLRKHRPSSFHRSQNFNSQGRKTKIAGLDKFQTFVKKSVPETNIKSRVKPQEKSFKKSTENIHIKKKEEHSRYMTWYKNPEKIKRSPSQNNQSPNIIDA